MKNKNCPICDKNMLSFERYPNMICNECVELAVNKNGDSIKFYNIDPTGGFMSIVNNIKGKEHECYINNQKCLANESRFGGIVVELSK
jgi:hypothetical protein